MYKTEHIQKTNNSFDSALSEAYGWVLENDFVKENCVLITVHSRPNEAPSAEHLVDDFLLFLNDTPFNMIYMTEYRNSCKNINSHREDYCSTTHIHGLVEASYCELKAYIEQWNKMRPPRSNPLMIATPIESDIYTAFIYNLKEYHSSEGFLKQPYGIVLKKEQLTDCCTISSEKPNSTLTFFSIFKCYRMLILQLLFHRTSFQISLRKSLQFWCIDNQPNAPP